MPRLEELEEELEARFGEPVLLNIMSALVDRLSQSSGHLEVLFQPARMYDVIESKFYSDDEKTKFFELYQKLISEIHVIVASLYQDRKARADAVVRVFKFYKEEIKPFMKKYALDQVEKWKNYKEAKQTKEKYFG